MNLGLEPLYPYYTTVPLLHHCTPTTPLYPYYTTVPLLHHCTPTTPLYPYYTTVPLLHHCTPTTPLYPYYTTVPLLHHCTSTTPLYPYYTTVPLHHCTPTTPLYPYYTTVPLLHHYPYYTTTSTTPLYLYYTTVFVCVYLHYSTGEWLVKVDVEVTKKSFGSGDFRTALENGVLLCDLMNQLKPGVIKRLNRLSTPIAGLDNVNVFLKACVKLGLNESQLFHPGDLQDLSSRATLRKEESNRRLKNVLITLYWLGRRAQLDPFYCGPQLNFKAFEGLLGLALSKALEEGSGLCPRDGGFSDPDKENPGRVGDDSLEALDYPDPRAAHQGSEGCGSDVEADQVFTMSAPHDSAQQRERGHAPPGGRGCAPPALLRRKRGLEEKERGCPSPLTRLKMSVWPSGPEPNQFGSRRGLGLTCSYHGDEAVPGLLANHLLSSLKWLWHLHLICCYCC
ncbi:hypothetical protein NHX12_005488 [Muraenolepis orangiensis]|uniref:Calponin-homology (CH) domain-containing protein n=1 Tax=Muraenolepis orangiensis TaxID=630683 RepID=A0A9Q0DRN7_9TELE|nr:hypothetical protein NHX12_005488 [Muraenolepis orangiensis]